MLEITKVFLISIQISHLLCSTCLSIYASRSCSNNILSNTVYNLIPDDYDSFTSSSNQNKSKTYSVPTKSHINKICWSWFFHLVNEIQQQNDDNVNDKSNSSTNFSFTWPLGCRVRRKLQSTPEGKASKEKRNHQKRRRNCDDKDEVRKEFLKQLMLKEPEKL